MIHFIFVSRSTCSTLMQRFTVDEALDTVSDDDFSLSDDKSSEEEELDDLYALLGEPVVRRSDIDALTRDFVVGDGDSDGNGDSDGSSDSEDVGDQASDGPGDVPSFTDPEDPLVCDENFGSSPPSLALEPSESFTGKSQGDNKGEISDEKPMVMNPWLLVLI